jgi:hypothetical protein
MTFGEYVRLGLEAVVPRSTVASGAEAPGGGMPSNDPPRYGLMALTTAVTFGIFFGTLYGIQRKA